MAKPEVAQTLSDFELVRNAEGQWLLVLPELAGPLSVDPLTPLRARLDGDELALETEASLIALQSLIAPHYAEALRADKPQYLLLSVIDDDGAQRLLRKITFSC